MLRSKLIVYAEDVSSVKPVERLSGPWTCRIMRFGMLLKKKIQMVKRLEYMKIFLEAEL